MKFIIRIILISSLSYLSAMFFPWWGIALVAALVSFLLPDHGFSVFVSGFLGAGLLWMALAWKTDIETASVLSEKIVQLFPVSEVNYLILATGLIGGLAGAFSGLTGSTFRQVFMKKKQKSYYS